MEWLTRLIGIGLIFGLAAWSVNYYEDALENIEDRVAKQAAAQPVDQDVDLSPIGQQPPPKYLAFQPGIRSGNYDIDDLPGSRDRDYSLRRSNSSSDDESSDDESSDDESSGLVDGGIDPEGIVASSGSLMPGIYATSFEATDCRYELHRVMKGRKERLIGADHLIEGRMIVVINEIEPDRFIATPSCGDWGEWSPLVEPLKVASNGDYWIGDLARGPWVVPESCLWEKVVGFRGAQLFDVQESGWGPQRLVVNSKTLGVRIRGCTEPIVHASLL